MNRISLFTLAAILLTGHVSLAQIEKGSKLLGASMNVTVNNAETHHGNLTNEIDQTVFSLNPHLGFFIKDGLALGGGLNLYTSQWTKNEPSTSRDEFGTENRYRTGASFFVKKMNPISERLGWYFQPSIRYNYGWGTQESETTFYDTNGNPEETVESASDIREHHFNVGAAAGLYYFVADHWSIEVSLLSATLSHSKTTFADQENAIPDTEFKGFTLDTSLTNSFSITMPFTVNYYF